MGIIVDDGETGSIVHVADVADKLQEEVPYLKGEIQLVGNKPNHEHTIGCIGVVDEEDEISLDCVEWRHWRIDSSLVIWSVSYACPPPPYLSLSDLRDPSQLRSWSTEPVEWERSRRSPC